MRIASIGWKSVVGSRISKATGNSATTDKTTWECSTQYGKTARRCKGNLPSSSLHGFPRYKLRHCSVARLLHVAHNFCAWHSAENATSFLELDFQNCAEFVLDCVVHTVQITVLTEQFGALIRLFSFVQVPLCFWLPGLSRNAKELLVRYS